MGRRGGRRLLEDLHARGMSSRPLPGRGPRVAMPVPSIHVRHPARRRAGFRSGRSPASAAPARHRRGGLPDRAWRFPGAGGPELLERALEGCLLMLGWLDRRLGADSWARSALRKVFPDHWSFLLGEIALFCYVVLLATGIFLTFFFTGATTTVTYQGSYVPLQGAEVSAAFDSVMRLSFDVRAGLLMRQVHHW